MASVREDLLNATNDFARSPSVRSGGTILTRRAPVRRTTTAEDLRRRAEAAQRRAGSRRFGATGRRSGRSGALMDRGGGRRRDSFLGGSGRTEEVMGDRSVSAAVDRSRVGSGQSGRGRTGREIPVGVTPGMGGSPRNPTVEDVVRGRSPGVTEAPDGTVLTEPAGDGAGGGGEAATPAEDQSGPVTEEGAVGLENLRAILERRLGTPSAFDMEVVQEIRSALDQERAGRRAQAASDINVDAARRGVFHSTVPAFDVRELEKSLAEEEALADAQLTQAAAAAQDQGLQSAVSDAFRFLENADAGQMGRSQLELERLRMLGSLGNLATQLGFQGGPTLGGAVGHFAGLPGAQAGGLDPTLFAVLGQLLNQGGGGDQLQQILDVLNRGGGGEVE